MSSADTVGYETAIQLTYLVAGAQRVLDLDRVTKRLQGVEDDHPIVASGGHIGMVGDLFGVAAVIAGKIATHSFRDFPSVFEYEVTEPFGEWLANNWTTDIAARFDDELDKRIANFFEL